MLTLTVRTDKPVSELGLVSDSKQIDYIAWDAHRLLAETIHANINEILVSNNKSLQNIKGVIVYKGPGSFTGLRIGVSVVNALAYGLDIPAVGVEGEEDWINRGISLLQAGEGDNVVIPEYGGVPNITEPKK